MALDIRKMRFTDGVVLTQAQWDERKKNAPKYRISASTLIALAVGLNAGMNLPPRRY